MGTQGRHRLSCASRGAPVSLTEDPSEMAVDTKAGSSPPLRAGSE